MGIYYTPSSGWVINNEKTDYKTDLKTDYPTNLPETFNRRNENVQRAVTKYRTETYYETEYRTVQKSEYDSCATRNWQGQCEGGFVTRYVSEPTQVQKTRTVPYTDFEKDYNASIANANWNREQEAIVAANKKANDDNRIINDLNQKENAANQALNTKNADLNAKYQQAKVIAGTTKGDDYLEQRDQISKLGIQGLEGSFKDFYLNEKLEIWDPKLGAQPPYGTFDAKYYAQQNPEAKAIYEEAVAKDDVDIVNRYGSTNYYLWDYTTQGKALGKRGNKEEVPEQAKAYIEKKPTDQELQQVRDLQLGIDTATQTDRLLNIPEVAAEWEKAKRDDPYWRNLGKQNFLDVNKPDEFAALFRISDRPEDKQVSINYNINAGYGITDLEDALNQAVGEKATVDVKRFGALAQDVLKETINEMKQAKAKEQMLGLLGGFSGFSEIMDINKQLSNSILGDTGIGGLLSFTSGGKAEESLEKSLQNITGVKNNSTYNWQQWFDNELKTRYQNDLELGYSPEQADEKIKIEGEFARQFIDDYLIPRFNTSRSMDEFVEYLDIRQEEQNPFQTQDMLNAVSLVADLRAKQYLDQIKTIGDRYFDSEFYFNPTGNKAREEQYLNQAETVAKDWEDAKKGDPYWAQQAYRFGIDVNNKDEFARIHFQVKGQGQGYDAAKDILTAGGVQDEIYNNILPALKEEALKQGSVFGQFVTPEEFADEMLRGLDPADKSTWDEVLQRYGLTDFKGTVDELKEYIVETLRTGSAQEIREQIKYLNEKRQRPTQAVLGLTYIERPEDYKDEMATPQTELYKVFQSAGYQGTEDEFYTNFFPDVDRSEQTLLTKAGSDSALKTYGLDLSDPFASLGTIESFFDTDKTEDTEDTGSKSSFFTLGLDEEKEPDYKSKTGTQILGEFTSMFKGL